MEDRLTNTGVFDIEATSKIKTIHGIAAIHFAVLGFFDGTDYRDFFSVETFLNHIDQKKYNKWIHYAHNGGNFDFKFLFEELLARHWVVKAVPRAGALIAIHCQGKKASFVLRDSYALLPDSLRRLADSFKTKHRKLDMDYRKIKAQDKKTREYLQNDCLALYEVLEEFSRLEFIDGNLKLTIASQSLWTFKKYFCSFEPFRMRLEDEEYIRRHFYSGGRVEVYKGYGKNVNSYDVNSLFPYAMLSDMPVGNAKETTRFVPYKIGYYRCKVGSTPQWYISPLLLKHDRRNYYVTGEGEYYLSSSCIEMLRHDFGVRVTVSDGFYFEGKEKIFVAYVNHWYKVKQAHKKEKDAQYYLAKYMLNALYGKFGQSRHQEVLFPVSAASEIFYGTSEMDTFGLAFRIEESRSVFVMPYVAAWITELARLHHFRLMNQHPESMYYCDTDSLFTSAIYPTSDRIGELSHAGKFEAVFLAPKTYALKVGKTEVIHFKGFDTAMFNFAYLKSVALSHGKKQLKQVKHRILGFRECMTRKADVADSSGTWLKVAKQTKVATANIETRLTKPSKKHILETTPYTYSQLEG